jgi:hypothetical protein
MLHLNTLRRVSAILSTNVKRMTYRLMVREPRLSPGLHFDGTHDLEAVAFIVALSGVLGRGHVGVSGAAG